MNNKAFTEEEIKLKEVIEIINEKLKKAEINFSEQENFIIGFKEGMRGTQFNRQAMMSMYATEINDLNMLLPSPYFGRFTFKKNTDGISETIYIGKKILTDTNGNIISYDWRSPICSVYYDYNIGNAEYISDNQVVKGEILGKRQIVIQNSILKSVTEQDALSNDSVLLKLLSENADSRLKTIVATIQKEQNAIIRSPLNRNYIIQGVAGSGKTTVALHRIAYLVYNEAKNIQPSEFMIIGPNNIFLNYISELLPDLDIKGVTQSTYEDLALSVINCKVKVNSQNVILKDILNGKINSNVIAFKGTIQFLKYIEKFIYLFIISHIQRNITYHNIILYPKEKIQEICNGLYSNYKVKIDNLIKQIVKNIKDRADELQHEVWLEYREEFLNLEKDNPRRKEILDITNKMQSELKKGCAQEVKDYFKFMKTNPLDLYRTFIENIEKFCQDSSVNLDEFKQYTLDKIDKKIIDSEDLTALVYINYLLNGIRNYEHFAHLVIDEAQDLSMSQYYVLKALFPKCTFDIFGDLNQSIYSYKSISDWDELNDNIFDSTAKEIIMDKSYRTTVQISNAANLVLNYTNRYISDSISRFGKDVITNELDSKNSALVLVNQINELLHNGSKTIAIICKDEEETDKVFKILKKQKINITKINEGKDEYTGGLCILPSYLSKGLEFDSVILYNANDLNYSDSDMDMKLLYVAITRAMHDLVINYSGDLAKPLLPLRGQNLIRKKN